MERVLTLITCLYTLSLHDALPIDRKSVVDALPILSFMGMDDAAMAMGKIRERQVLVYVDI